jgi:hypothetical protein
LEKRFEYRFRNHQDQFFRNLGAERGRECCRGVMGIKTGFLPVYSLHPWF